jgi:hypothetical protein
MVCRRQSKWFGWFRRSGSFFAGYFFHQRLHHLVFILSRCAEMKIAVMAGLLAKRDVDVDTGHE